MTNVIEMPKPDPEPSLEEDYALLYGAMSWLVGAWCGIPGRSEEDLPDHVQHAIELMRCITFSMVTPTKKPE